MTNVIAIGEKTDTAGAIVWWRLEGMIDRDALLQAWADAGLDAALVPSCPTPEVALRRAVQAEKAAHRLVRQLDDGSGWVLADERAVTEDALKYEHACVARVDAAARLSVTTKNASPLLEENIRRSYQAHLEMLSHQDISTWLVRLASVVGAVALREGGGVYFVPRGTLALWEQMVKAIRTVSANRIHQIPALRSEDAVEAIIDAVQREAQAEVEGMERVLDENKLGARALTNRATACSQIESKVSSYEALLGRSLETLREKLSTLRSRLAEAALAADEEVAA